MSGWSIHEGMGLALPMENIDTDQLIPARFMSVPRSQGYGAYLLYDMRFDGDGGIVPDMPLNRHPDASILVTRRNFGSGSSREAAVYALVDYGIRAVIAPSFGDIFASNAVNNGLLPARMDEDLVEVLIAALGDGTRKVRVDLEKGAVVIGDVDMPFELDPLWRTKLINGWDDIDMTASHADAITAFRDARRAAHSWAWPGN
ncbi:3-isopropylmalate dehydratase small subunit [Lutimaribacter saemankumensis]|uniref:3-isopropylmalate dehydratase n=1 Tax=Lutimaribacter saemankumensis TaxID=490829 RepID=A0A1G8J802_9RHOB|nr:3-isopropylmalate dehydratase small subunit [Lutimaribacter saemankumensis]SDI27379.1 3-isopropylmalate/(R)-2-methylmalate dehydratase small subunit [Lutimaribacter saemankumensis]